MLRHRAPLSHQDKGFSIIEVMIVLAIAGLIMAIVFLAVPQLQRNSRNTQIKSFANLASAQLENYYANNGLRYPTTNTLACPFILSYLARDSSTTCAYNNTKECEYAKVGDYYVCMHDSGGAHSYVGDIGEVSIESGHECNTPDHNDGTANPIMGIGDDSDRSRYVIWVLLEHAGIYCIDNFTG